MRFFIARRIWVVSLISERGEKKKQVLPNENQFSDGEKMSRESAKVLLIRSFTDVPKEMPFPQKFRNVFLKILSNEGLNEKRKLIQT